MTLRSFFLFLGLAMALAVGLRTWVLEPFHIESSHLMPTLQSGDFVFVEKFHRQYNRGAVVAIKNTPTFLSIRRVVGLPQEHLDVCYGKILSQGHEVDTLQDPNRIWRLPAYLAHEPCLSIDINADQYFVVPDIREGSSLKDLGHLVSRRDIVGLVSTLWFSVDQISGVRWQRIFSKIN